MASRPDLVGFSERLQCAGNSEERVAVLSQELAPLGIDHVFYGYGTTKDKEFPDQVRVMGNYPTRYIECYDAEKLIEDDHLAKHAICSDSPTRFHDPLTQQHLSPNEIRVEHIALDFGLSEGIFFPTREIRAGIFGGVTFVSRDMPKKDFDYLCSNFRSPLHLIAMHFHGVMQMAENPPDPIHLTKREIEVLQWASQGLQSEETAQRMGISMRTVNRHRENAQGKLGANNVTHSVAKALAMKLITL